MMAAAKTTAAGAGAADNLTLSDEEIFRILENPELNKFTPTLLGEIFEKNPILTEKISQLQKYYGPPSQESRATLLSGIVSPSPDLSPKQLPAGKEEIDLLIALSSTLRVDEVQCVHIWNDYLREIVLEGQKSFDYSRLKSVDIIVRIRDFYFRHSQYIWKILQEIIRIDGDRSHVYHEPASKYLDKLLQKGLVLSLTTSLEKLYKWDHQAPNNSDFQSFDLSLQEFSHFKATHRLRCAEDIVQRVERSLETALLLTYCRCETIKIEDFHRFLGTAVDGDFGHPKKVLQIISGPEIETRQCFLSFKWILLFSAIFQFWRIYLPDSQDLSPQQQQEQHRHQFTAESGGSTGALLLESIDGIILSLGRSRSGSVGYQDQGNVLRLKIGQGQTQGQGQGQSRLNSDTNDDQRANGTSSIVKFLWGLFLKSFGQNSNQSTKRCMDYIKESRQNGAFEYLVHLSTIVLGNPVYSRHHKAAGHSINEEDNPLGSDLTIYCIILQEVINAFINHISLDDAVVNMDALSSLIELIHRSDEQLCQCIWSRWIPSTVTGKIAEQDFPICKLIKLLAETSFHDPHHLVKILLAITCSTFSSREVALILSSPISIMSWVSWDDVQIGSSRTYDGFINWIDGRNWLQTNGSKPHVGQLPVLFEKTSSSSSQQHLQQQQHQQQEYIEPSYLIEPSIMNIGILLHKETHSLLVKWQCESTWLALIMNSLNSASKQLDSKTPNRHILVADALSLFAALLRHMQDDPLTTLSKDWNHLCLYSFLRVHDALEVYPAICPMSLKDLQSDQSYFYNQLLEHGIDANQSRKIVERSKLYLLPQFDKFLIESSVNLMFFFLSEMNSLQNYSTPTNILDQWRELLARSLSLLSSIALSASSPSCALTILRSITKVYQVESWAGMLSNISSKLEGTIGRYDVTRQTCHLLSVLFAALSTPLPAKSAGLEAVFQQFDLDGNGTISPKELQMGLARMGYEVTISAVDNFFQHIDGSNSSSIHFSKLLRYATTDGSYAPSTAPPTTKTDWSTSLSKATELISDIDRAQLGLALLLQDVIYPESREISQFSDSLALAVTSYTLDCLTQMNRWTYMSHTDRLELTISCLKILTGILSASSPLTPNIIRTNAVIRASEHFFHRFTHDKQLQDSLLHSCLNLSLTALQWTYTTTQRESCRSLKSFISKPTAILPGTNSGGLQPSILPINFINGSMDLADSLNVDLLEDISLQTIHLFTQILDIAGNSNELDSSNSLIHSCVAKLLDMMLSSAEVSSTSLFGNSMTNPLLTAHSSSAITNLDLPCLYFAVVVSLLDYPSSPLTPVIGHTTKIPTAAALFLSKLTSSLKTSSRTTTHAKSRRSFVDGLGYQNLEPFCRTICSWVKSKTNSGLKFALLDLLLTLSNLEPLTMVLLLNIPSISNDDSNIRTKQQQQQSSSSTSSSSNSSNSSTPVRPENSLLATTIEKLLQKTEYLYENHPMLLAKLYELILSLIDKSNHLSIGHFILNLCKSSNFWDFITIPLMHDISRAPPPDLGDTQDASQYLHGFSLKIDYERQGVIPPFCARLMTHALALRILARERFGTMFFIDTTDILTESKVNASKDSSNSNNNSSNESRHHVLAEKIEKNVDAFFEKANNSHRFLSWVKHYMQVDVDYSLQKEAEENAKSIGLNLGKLIAKQRTPTMGFPAYGGCYIYSFQIAEIMRAVAKYEITKTSNPRNSSHLDNWTTCLDQIIRLNCMWSVADSQMIVLRSWREFIEVYVQSSPNRPGAYIVNAVAQTGDHHTFKRHDSLESRDSNSDDDQPGTPRSLAHSESQTSGLHSPSFLTGKNSPQSPTRENTSSFTGDKRSYELVTEILKQLSLGKTPQGNESLFSELREGFLAANIAVEKCNLLVSMLHHQLKFVSYRTTDPSRSRVLNRDTGSTRLKSKKMVELLQTLSFVYKQYVESLDAGPPSLFKMREYHSSKDTWLLSKKMITLRLLTSILLLHQGLKQSIGDHQTATDIYLSGYQISVEALRSELSLLEENGNPEDLSGGRIQQINNGGKLSTTEAIIQTSLRLLRYVTPMEIAALNSSELRLWREQFNSSSLIPIILGTFTLVSKRNKSSIQIQCNFSRWDRSFCVFNSGGGSTTADSLKFGFDGSSTISSKESRLDTSSQYWDILDCIFDYLLSEGMKSKSIVFEMFLENGLLSLLNENIIFREYQRFLQQESVSFVAALMGYDAMTGEFSKISSLWCKSLQLVQCASRFLNDVCLTPEMKLCIQNQISIFINSFRFLLLSPLPDGRGRMSLRQLEMSRITLLFFSECNQSNTIWRVHAQEVAETLLSKVLRMIGLCSLLLGDGDEKYSNTQQRTLHSYMVAVSQQERRGERRHTKRDRVVSKSHDSGIDADILSKGGTHSTSIISFIADSLQAILGVCEPAILFLRTVIALSPNSLSEGYGIDSMNGKLRFQHEQSCLHPIGSRIIYRNPDTNEDTFSQGIVHAVDVSGKYYTICSLFGTLDQQVPCQNVFHHTSPPLLKFESTSSLPRYVETDISSDLNVEHTSKSLFQGGYISYKGENKISTSSAHLVRLLKFTRFWEENYLPHQRRPHNVVKPNTDHLSAQLVWILAMTIADHSSLGNDIDALLRQLEEIDTLIRVGNSSSSHWIASEEWNQIRDWLSRMISRILGPHRTHSTWSYEIGDMEESLDTIYIPSIHKRLGASGTGSLRSGITFVDMIA